MAATQVKSSAVSTQTWREEYVWSTYTHCVCVHNWFKPCSFYSVCLPPTERGSGLGGWTIKGGMTLISGTHRCSVGENSDSIHRFLFFLPSFDLFQSLCRSFPTQLRLWTGTKMFVIHKRLRIVFITYLHPFFYSFTRPWIFSSLLQSSLKQPLIMCDTSPTGSIVRFCSNLIQANSQCHPQ